MSDFDPYYLWLGIPPQQQPANYYRLLGLNLFEADPAVISQAADRQMAYIRSLQSGPHGAASQKLLNELARARACLESPEQRLAYDAQLRATAAGSAGSTGSAGGTQPAAAPGATREGIKIDVGDRSTAAAAATRPAATKRAAPNVQVDARDSRPAQAAVAAGRPALGLPWWSVAAMIAAGVVVGLLVGVLLPGGQTASDVPGPPIAAHAAGGRPNSGGAEIENPPHAAPGATALRPPEGVTAESVVIWNQRNAASRDRGARTGRLVLWSGSRRVWTSDELTLEWSADKDLPTTVDLPRERFDRLRLSVDSWHGRGGGLAEIEVVRDGRNIARSAPVLSSADYGENFRASRITDGIRDSNVPMSGYWLLPDRMPGWVMVDLAGADVPSTAIVADRVVVWNSHNAQYNNGGALRCNLILMHGDKIAWRKDDLTLVWVPGERMRTEWPIPQMPFDRLRIEVTESRETASLAEIEVWRGDTNVALGVPIETSTIHGTAYAAERLVDGIVDSNVSSVGYWHARRAGTAWIELDLRCSDPQAGRRWREIGEYVCSQEVDWTRGLAWLARSEDPELRLLAASDLENHPAGAERLSVAHSWLARAGSGSGPLERAMRLRAAWQLARSHYGVREFARRESDRQIERLLQGTTLHHFLYFHSPVSQSGIFGGNIAHRLVSVDSRPWNYGLWAHPEKDVPASIRYQIDGRYKRLEGGVAINDSSGGQSESPLVFRVIGDGKILWESEPFRQSTAAVSFSADLAGISILELLVESVGPNGWAHAVWLDPRLVP